MAGQFFGEATGLTPLTSSTDGAVVQWSAGQGAFIASTTITAIAPGTVSGLPKIVRRTGNSSAITATTVLASDDTLLWAVGASDTWFFEGFLVILAADSTGASTTEDIKVGFAVPANGTMQWGATSASATGTTSWSSTATSASPTVLKDQTNSQSFGAVAGTFGLSIAGFYAGGGTSGTVNLQWAQNTSNAATLQLLTNSFLRLTRIA